MEKHPDKTFVGRIERGFDFLGYHFIPAGLTVAKATIEKFLVRATMGQVERRDPDALARDVTDFRAPFQELYYCFENGLPPAR